MAELVGILNITPDSFSDGGRHFLVEPAVNRCQQLLAEGASLVDVGAESTRPGAKPLTWSQEVARLDGFVKEAKKFNWPLSIDSYHPETIDWVSHHLPEFIINDVSGFSNPQMRAVAARIGQTVIVSHLPKSSLGIQAAHQEKPIDSVDQVIEELQATIEELVVAGIDQSKIIVDPGLGFGKTKEVNWQLLSFGQFMPDQKTMVGYSKKKFLGANCQQIETNYLAGKIASDSGVDYLRVHDVAGHSSLI